VLKAADLFRLEALLEHCVEAFRRGLKVDTAVEELVWAHLFGPEEVRKVATEYFLRNGRRIHVRCMCDCFVVFFVYRRVGSCMLTKRPADVFQVEDVEKGSDLCAEFCLVFFCFCMMFCCWRNVGRRLHARQSNVNAAKYISMLLIIPLCCYLNWNVGRRRLARQWRSSRSCLSM
jgi:hypothetical protein